MATRSLTRVLSMRERVEDTLSAHRNELVSLLSRLDRLSNVIIYSYSVLLQCFLIFTSLLMDLWLDLYGSRWSYMRNIVPK